MTIIGSIASQTPREVFAAAQAGKTIALLDVRTPAEFASVHAKGAVSLPLDRVTPQAVAALRGDASVVHLICQSGGRSQNAAKALVAAGFADVVNVTGGTKQWEADGLPVVRGRKTIPLERQVFVVAGLIVLAGCALAFWVDARFILISAFVGLGLTLAGSIGFCPMAMMLAKMPWNQRADEGAPAGSCCSR